MITDLSITTLMIIIFALTALIIILRKFYLPKSFYENQAKREALLKGKIGVKDEKPEDEESDETLVVEESTE